MYLIFYFILYNLMAGLPICTRVSVETLQWKCYRYISADQAFWAHIRHFTLYFFKFLRQNKSEMVNFVLDVSFLQLENLVK
jgi:hypothetical protein